MKGEKERLEKLAIAREESKKAELKAKVDYVALSKESLNQIN